MTRCKQRYFQKLKFLKNFKKIVNPKAKGQLTDASYLSDIESAFDSAWDLANRRDGWRSAKTVALAAGDSVDRVEWRSSEGDAFAWHDVINY